MYVALSYDFIDYTRRSMGKMVVDWFETMVAHFL